MRYDLLLAVRAVHVVNQQAAVTLHLEHARVVDVLIVGVALPRELYMSCRWSRMDTVMSGVCAWRGCGAQGKAGGVKES